MELKWEKYCDEYGNSFWKAKAEYSYYVIRQKLMENKIVYYEDSAQELWIEKYAPYREVYSTLEEAKNDMYWHCKVNKNYDSTRSI